MGIRPPTQVVASPCAPRMPFYPNPKLGISLFKRVEFGRITFYLKKVPVVHACMRCYLYPLIQDYPLPTRGTYFGTQIIHNPHPGHCNWSWVLDSFSAHSCHSRYPAGLSVWFASLGHVFFVCEFR